MKFTVSLKQNFEFRRLYAKGKTAVNPVLALYARKSKPGANRLGITVGGKVGNAVVRNRTRRRIREAYRLHEGQFAAGYDLVVVARVRAAHVRYDEVERALLKAARALDLLRREEGQG